MNHPANIPPPNWQEGRKPGRCPSMFQRLPLDYWHECDCELFVIYIPGHRTHPFNLLGIDDDRRRRVLCHPPPRLELLVGSFGVPRFLVVLPPTSRLPAVFLFWLCIVQSSKICRSSSTSPISSTVIFWSRKLYEKIFRVDRLFLYDRDFKE